MRRGEKEITKRPIVSCVGGRGFLSRRAFFQAARAFRLDSVTGVMTGRLQGIERGLAPGETGA
jgi:hypothetical protein